MQVMILFVLYDPPRAARLARRRAVLLAAALAALTACFVATPTEQGRFTSPDAPAGVLAYYLVYTGYLGVTLTAMSLLLSRYAGRASDRWLRLSLRLYAWSCVVGLCYLAGRIGNLVVGRIHPDFADSGEVYGLLEFLVAAVAPAAGVLLVLVAVVIRTAGRRIEYRRADRRLRPLWEAVRAARPYTVLTVPGRGGARWRLYRRVIEIEDGRLAAARHVDTATLARIDAAVAEAGLSGSRADATRAAAILAAGLSLHAPAAIPGSTPAGLSLTDPGRTPAGLSLPAPGRTPAGPDDFGALVQFLDEVAAAFTVSPVVRCFAHSRDSLSP